MFLFDVDPVMIAATGDRLLSEDAEDAYADLIEQSTLVTLDGSIGEGGIESVSDTSEEPPVAVVDHGGEYRAASVVLVATEPSTLIQRTLRLSEALVTA